MNPDDSFSRRVRSIWVTTLIVFTGDAFLGVTPANATLVAEGAVLRANPEPNLVRLLPEQASGEFSRDSLIPHNLGGFDIVINPSAALAGNLPALQAFNRAAAKWESFIADPITVTINADFSPLGGGILGSTGSVFLQTSYNAMRNQLASDASNETDDAIVASMPTAAQFTATLPAGFGLGMDMIATKANMKAMGFGGLDASFGVMDAEIAFSTDFTFDFDNSDGVTAGHFDFEGVAIHEIGHALGFVSIVDTIDAILPGTSNNVSPMPLDLFRFRDGSANDPSTPLEFTLFARDLVPGSNDVFDQVNSGHGGDTEVRMSTGVNNGDGRQASHWKDHLSLGIMDPTAAPGELLVMLENDMRAMDLIGYEVSAVPELGGLWLVLLAGTLAFGGHWLASKKSKADKTRCEFDEAAHRFITELS
jgi:hypothetical protein